MLLSARHADLDEAIIAELTGPTLLQLASRDDRGGAAHALFFTAGARCIARLAYLNIARYAMCFRRQASQRQDGDFRAAPAPCIGRSPDIILRGEIFSLHITRAVLGPSPPSADIFKSRSAFGRLAQTPNVIAENASSLLQDDSALAAFYRHA